MSMEKHGDLGGWISEMGRLLGDTIYGSSPWVPRCLIWRAGLLVRRRENRIRVQAQEVAFSSSNHVEEAALFPFSLCRYFLIIPLASFVEKICASTDPLGFLSS